VFYSNVKIPSTYHLIDNPKKLSWLANVLLSSQEFAFDIETNWPTAKSLRGKVPPDYPHLVAGISFAWGRTGVTKPWQSGNAAYVQLRRSDDSPFWGSRQKQVEEILREVQECDIPKVAHNGKFDVRQLANLMGIYTKNLAWDTMLMHTLLDEDTVRSSHALKSEFSVEGREIKRGTANEYLDIEASEFKNDLQAALLYYDSKMQRYSKVPTNVLYPYACADSDMCLSLKYAFLPLMEAENLVPLMTNLVMPLQHTLMIMELHGCPLDLHRARQVLNEQAEIMKASEAEVQRIFQFLNVKFNVGSPDQLGKVLFEYAGYPGRKSADGSCVTDGDELKKLPQEVGKPLLDFRRAQQIHGLYAEPALRKVVEITNEGYIGWVHPEYWMDSKTGRLKLTDPNLTTLPRPENGGIIVKSMWCADDRHRMIFKDFSQIELKVIAHISGEPVWVEGFNNGYDMHAAMAKKIWNLPCEVDQVKDLYKKERSHAKTINFGIAYGQSEKALAESLGISKEEAHKLIWEDYFGAAPVLKAWIDETHEFVKNYGYVTNIFGRRRHLPEAMTEIPHSVMAPAFDRRPECYRKDPPYPKILEIPLEDIYNIDPAKLRDHVKSKKSLSSFAKCSGCPYIHSCIINREVMRAQAIVNRALRQSVNSPIQGSAVDMASLALTWIYQEIRRYGLKASPMLHIHDELVIYSHVECVEQVSRIMDDCMTTRLRAATSFRVPLTVDTEVVQRWSAKHTHDE
jgi:DNA polymerase I-like protein with 3'-5' exonuclease and polymerase domains